MGLIQIFYDVIDFIESATTILVMGIAFAGIIAMLLVSILKIQKINKPLAIVTSTLVCCILMIPFVTSFNNLANLNVKGSIIREAKDKIKSARSEANRLRLVNKAKELEQEVLDNRINIANNTIEIGLIDEKIKQLKETDLGMQSFQQILELALVQANIKQNMVRKEFITKLEEGWIFKDNTHAEEILVILYHDINAKFGVDLNKIKIFKHDEQNITVSGIRSKFIGSDRSITNEIVKEVRRVNYKKGFIDTVIVQNDRVNIGKADELAREYEREFQEKLSQGLEIGFMNDAVVKLAQNFLTVILEPYQWNIKFTDEEQPEALPVMQFFQKELEKNYNITVELLKVNENLLGTSQKTEAEAAKINTEIMGEYGFMDI
ncbi:MAG: hypothetical protein FWH35_00750 [Treponema sp.]|nr:hypothetical protein [Treponema sp.]